MRKHAFAGQNTQHPTNALGTRNASEKNQIYQHFKAEIVLFEQIR